VISSPSIAVASWGQVDLDISTDIPSTLATSGVVLPKGVVRGHPNPLHLKLALRLRTARRRSKLSASRLALDAGLSDGVVRHIEDAGGIPGVTTVERLATALGLSAAWLAFGPPSPRLPVPQDLTEETASFAERLSAARTLRGLSRKALAKSAELSLTAVSGLEGGQIPNVATVERLARALKISPGWLAFGLETATQAQTMLTPLPLPLPLGR
jgi:transcriptional regulator with XRE-family HTH domain